MRNFAVIISLLSSIFLFGQKGFDLNDKINLTEYKITSCISDSSLIDNDTLILNRYKRPFGIDEARINNCGDSISICFPSLQFEKTWFTFIYKGEANTITYFDPKTKDSISNNGWLYLGFSGKYSYLNDTVLVLTPNVGRTKHSSYYFLVKKMGDSFVFINQHKEIIEKKED